MSAKAPREAAGQQHASKQKKRTHIEVAHEADGAKGTGQPEHGQEKPRRTRRPHGETHRRGAVHGAMCVKRA